MQNRENVNEKAQSVMVGREVLMMKKLCILGILLCIVLSGCGNTVETNTVENKKITNSTTKVLADEIEQIEEDRADAVLMEQYPEWFNKDGNIVYPYTPYKPKKWKKAWKKAGSYLGLTEMLQIPEELVDALSTKCLLKAVEDYPLWSVNRYNNIKEAVEDFSRTLYGMEVLLERKDCGRVAFESYCSRNIRPTKKYSDNKNYSKDLDLLNQLVLEEYLIAQEKTYETLDNEERSLMVKTYRKNKKKKEKLKAYSDSWYDLYSFEATVSNGDNPWNKIVRKKLG